MPTDEVGTHRYERPEQLDADAAAAPATTRSPAAASRTGSSSTASALPRSIFAADQALAFERRTTLVRVVEHRNDLKLCGATVVCPGGDGS